MKLVVHGNDIQPLSQAGVRRRTPLTPTVQLVSLLRLTCGSVRLAIVGPVDPCDHGAMRDTERPVITLPRVRVIITSISIVGTVI